MAEFRLSIHLQAIITLLAVSYNSNPYTTSHMVSLVWVQHTGIPIQKSMWYICGHSEMTHKKKWLENNNGLLMGGANFKRTIERREGEKKGRKLPEAEPTLRLQDVHIVFHQVKVASLCLTAVALDISSWLSHYSWLSSNSTSSEGPPLIAQPNVALVSLPWPPYHPVCVSSCAHRLAYLDWPCLLISVRPVVSPQWSISSTWM